MTAVIAYFRDFGGEVVSTGIPVQSISTQAQRQAIVDQIQLWSVGQNDGADEVLQLEARIGAGATSPLAQSGMFAYFVFKDNVNSRTYKERLPMPDLAKAVDLGGEQAWIPITDSSGNSITHMNMLHADAVTLKAAMEAAYVSPAGNTAELVDVFIPNNL